MARVKRLAAMSKTALADADLRADQWTGQAVAGLLDDDPAELAGISRFAGVLEWALSAERVRFVPGAAVEVRYRLSLDPRLRVERTVSATEIEAALASLDATHSEQLVAELRAGLSISLPVLGQNVALLPEDVMITVQAEAGWIAAADSDLVIRLELMP
jgi:hypothetical protein